MAADFETLDTLPGAATRTPGATPSSPERERQLRDAAELGDVAAIDALIHTGVDPNAGNCADNAALHYADWRGHTAAITALLAAGADPLARNSYGASPRDIALREGHREAAGLLRHAIT